MRQILISLGWLAGLNSYHAYSNRVVETKTCLKLLADVKPLNGQYQQIYWTLIGQYQQIYWTRKNDTDTRSSGTPIELACIS